MRENEIREKRITRGVRKTNLEGSDEEFDKEFYESEFWLDGQGSDEESYEEKEEDAAPDEFDSDFNDTEDDEDEESDEESALQKSRKKDRAISSATTNKYREPKQISKPGVIAVTKRKVSFSEGVGAAPVKRKKVENASSSELVTSRTVRESTKTKSQDTEAADALRREALELRQKQQQRMKQREAIKHQFDQKQLLEECLETEIMNLRWIENRKALAKANDALVEKSAKQNSEKECIRRISKRGQYNVVIFPSTESMPKILNISENEYPETKAKALCVVTGMPARYRDPKTMLPYANSAAFQILRQNPTVYLNNV